MYHYPRRGGKYFSCWSVVSFAGIKAVKKCLKSCVAFLEAFKIDFCNWVFLKTNKKRWQVVCRTFKEARAKLKNVILAFINPDPRLSFLWQGRQRRENLGLRLRVYKFFQYFSFPLPPLLTILTSWCFPVICLVLFQKTLHFSFAGFPA